VLIDGISRRQMQELAIVALKGVTAAGESVFDFGTWPTDPKLFPMLMVSVPRERKINQFAGTLQFNTTMSIVVVGRVAGFLAEPVGTFVEDMSEQITDAILLDPVLSAQIQQYTIVETQTVVSSEGQNFIGEVGLTFEVVLYQAYGPSGPPLTDVVGTIDPVGGTPGHAPTITINLDSGI
jgi:hypothetical protein